MFLLYFKRINLATSCQVFCLFVFFCNNNRIFLQSVVQWFLPLLGNLHWPFMPLEHLIYNWVGTKYVFYQKYHCSKEFAFHFLPHFREQTYIEQTVLEHHGHSVPIKTNNLLPERKYLFPQREHSNQMSLMFISFQITPCL